MLASASPSPLVASFFFSLFRVTVLWLLICTGTLIPQMLYRWTRRRARGRAIEAGAGNGQAGMVTDGKDADGEAEGEDVSPAGAETQAPAIAGQGPDRLDAAHDSPSTDRNALLSAQADTIHLQTANTRLETANSALTSTNARLEKQYTSVQSSLVRLQHDNARLAKDLAASVRVDHDNTTLRTTITRLQADAAANISARKNAVASAAAAALTNHQDSSTALARSQEAQSSAQQALETVRAQLETNLAEAVPLHATTRERQAAQIDALERQLRQSHARINDLSPGLESAQTETTLLGHDKDISGTGIFACQQTAAAEAEEADSLKRQLRRTCRSVSELQQRLDEAKRAGELARQWGQQGWERVQEAWRRVAQLEDVVRYALGRERYLMDRLWEAGDEEFQFVDRERSEWEWDGELVEADAEGDEEVVSEEVEVRVESEEDVEEIGNDGWTAVEES